MVDVFVRALPEDVYDWLQKKARRENRTVPAEVRHLLEQMAHTQNDEGVQAFELSAQMRRKMQRVSVPSEELLRKDRDRDA